MTSLPKSGARNAIATTHAGPRVYVSFSVGTEQYALEALHVLEVRRLEPMTPVENAPDFVKGVVLLREAAVPIVDLRTLLGAAEERTQGSACVILINMHGGTVGMIVDAVSGVVELVPDQIEAAPDSLFGEGIVLPKRSKRRKTGAAGLLH
jgi:purine-binding chemotaxis protein CheW